MKNVYVYSETTGELVQATKLADLAAIPRNATTKPPPKLAKYQTAVFKSSTDSWSKVDDYRGKYWRIDGSGMVWVRDLGEQVPAGVTDVQQPVGTSHYDVGTKKWIEDLNFLKDARMHLLAQEERLERVSGYTLVDGKRLISQSELEAAIVLIQLADWEGAESIEFVFDEVPEIIPLPAAKLAVIAASKVSATQRKITLKAMSKIKKAKTKGEINSQVRDNGE